MRVYLNVIGRNLFLIPLVLALIFMISEKGYTAGGKPPEGMVLIPGGKFLYGEDKKGITLKDFYIDKTEVTNEDYKKIMSDHIFSSEDVNHPVREVSWFDANEYCKAVGKRLPTEEEWEKAARGKDGRIYPWGNTYDMSRANSADLGKRKPVMVGSFKEGASPYGVYDMAGNVWEWTDSWYDELKKYIVIRGGSYFEAGADFTIVTKRLRSIPDDIHEYIGFRCVKD